MEYNLNEYHRNIPDDELLKDIIRVSQNIKKIHLLQLNIWKMVGNITFLLFREGLERGQMQSYYVTNNQQEKLLKEDITAFLKKN